jgi:Mg-chelatase subunit ChlD
MRRITRDVPRWHVYLHRAARGLSPVDEADPPLRRLEDEIFDRLYSGGGDLLDAKARDAALASWADRIHAACDELPDFARLASECLGDADAAALAVEKLLEELQPRLEEEPLEPRPLRRILRTACDRASSSVEELHDVVDGLGFVQIGGREAGTGTWVGGARPNPTACGLAQRVRSDARLRRIALLAGRFKRIAAAKRRQKVRHGADEITDVEQGGDLARLLPAELARFAHPRLRLAGLRDLLERQCLQYRLTGTETLGKGPLVVCLDKSSSMNDNPDIWATAVALALLDVAQRERRAFALLGFDEVVKYESFVPVGGELPEDALFAECGGGTDLATALDRALTIIEQHPGVLRKADAVLITDGETLTERAPTLRGRAAELGATVLGIGIGVAAEKLAPWCDEAHAITDLNRLDDQTAEMLFQS